MFLNNCSLKFSIPAFISASARSGLTINTRSCLKRGLDRMLFFSVVCLHSCLARARIARLETWTFLPRSARTDYRPASLFLAKAANVSPSPAPRCSATYTRWALTKSCSPLHHLVAVFLESGRLFITRRELYRGDSHLD